MIRAVLDTNVIVSSFLTPGGTSGRLRRAFANGLFEVCLSIALLEEIDEVLRRPKIIRLSRVPREEVKAFVTGLPRIARIVEPLPYFEGIVADDPDDDILFATAMAAEAQFIVSGDDAVLRVGDYHGIHVVSPHVFLKVLEA